MAENKNRKMSELMFNKTFELMDQIDELLKTVDLKDNLNSKISQLCSLFKQKVIVNI